MHLPPLSIEEEAVLLLKRKIESAVSLYAVHEAEMLGLTKNIKRWEKAIDSLSVPKKPPLVVTRDPTPTLTLVEELCRMLG